MRNSKLVVLVEDDSVDAMTVKCALEHLKVSNLYWGLCELPNGR
ncbi:MAG: hypothetical protein ACE5NM_03700 [Sedimentisphaerales bacterium]